MLARTLTCMTCTIGLAVSLSAISGTPAAAQFTFEQYEVVTDSAARQSIVTGFLLDGAFADLAVVHLDENDDRRLRIYAFGAETWVPRLDATLGLEPRLEVAAVLGGLRGRLVGLDRLIDAPGSVQQLTEDRIGIPPRSVQPRRESLIDPVRHPTAAKLRDQRVNVLVDQDAFELPGSWSAPFVGIRICPS